MMIDDRRRVALDHARHYAEKAAEALESAADITDGTLGQGMRWVLGDLRESARKITNFQQHARIRRDDGPTRPAA